MRKLILVRHAKSSWDTMVDDFNRPLSKRGITDAHLVSQELLPFLPEKFIIWTSDAKRANETAVIIAQNMEINIEDIIAKNELYTFEEEKLTAVIKTCKKEHETLILFGHNAAITDFVNKFGDIKFDNIPTSTVVIIEFDQDDWDISKPGKISRTIFPKELK